MSDQIPNTVDLFHTPKSWDELHEWIALHSAEDRPHLITAAMMAWNLAHYSVARKAESEVLG